MHTHTHTQPRARGLQQLLEDNNSNLHQLQQQRCVGFFIGSPSVIILFVSQGLMAYDRVLCQEHVFAMGCTQ